MIEWYWIVLIVIYCIGFGASVMTLTLLDVITEGKWSWSDMQVIGKSLIWFILIIPLIINYIKEQL